MINILSYFPKKEQQEIIRLFKRKDKIKKFKKTISVVADIDHYLVYAEYNDWGLEGTAVTSIIKIPKEIVKELDQIYTDIHKWCQRNVKYAHFLKNPHTISELKEKLDDYWH